MLKPLMTIELKSINKTILNLYVSFLKHTFLKLKILGTFIMLPNIKKRLTLLKSPHVYKKAREQFEIKTYKQIIKIQDLKINFLLKYLILNKPAEISLTVKYQALNNSINNCTFDSNKQNSNF